LGNIGYQLLDAFEITWVEVTNHRSQEACQNVQTRNSDTFPVHFSIGTPDVVCVETQCVHHVAAKRLNVPELANERREHTRYHLNSATTNILSLGRRTDYLRLDACYEQSTAS